MPGLQKQDLKVQSALQSCILSNSMQHSWAWSCSMCCAQARAHTGFSGGIYTGRCHSIKSCLLLLHQYINQLKVWIKADMAVISMADTWLVGTDTSQPAGAPFDCERRAWRA